MPEQPADDELEKRIRQLESTEIRLRESEARFRALSDKSPVGIAIVNDQYQYIFVNQEFCNIAGYLEEEILGADFFFLLAEESKQLAIERYLRRQRGESVPDRYEVSFIRKNGDRRIGEVQSTVFTDAEGRANSLLQAYDITDRKQAEIALKESKEKFRFLAEKMGDIIWTMDLDLKTTYVSPSIISILGFTHEERKQQALDEMLTPESLDHVLDVFQRETAREKTGDFDPDRTVTLEIEYYHKNGSTVWMENIIKGMRNSHGKLTGIYGLARNINERKQFEVEQKKLQALLSHAQKMESVGRLAGGVAHDFNNMLSVILGHAELALKKTGQDHPTFTDLMEIQKAAQRSADLTRQLLAFARKQTIAPRLLDLNETITGMLNMLQRLIGEEIDLVWAPANDIWPVRMDPSQIDQILANLCVNAKDAITGIGKITIETANLILDKTSANEMVGFVPGEYVLLTLSDTGCGMDRQTLEKLFEPFFTTKAVGRGTGLGLATVYGIVKQNKGYIHVDSEVGRGTTFTIYLPRHMSKAVQKGPESSSKPVVSEGTETILLVEDEPAILDMITMMLSHQGYTVVAAPTPGEAIHLAREHAGNIHLLLTDVVMPEMNGRDLAKTLLPLYPDLKRLFMSGYTAEAIAHHGMLDEGVHFIQKPFSMGDLTAKVREALENQRAASVLTS